MERSVDGNYWAEIARVDATDGILNYTGIDPSPGPGYNMYRIKLTKKNNAVIYSAIQKIYVPRKNETIIIYPNPASNKITVTGITSGSLLTLSDISGKQIWQKKIVTDQNAIVLNLPSLPSGIYVMKIDERSKRLIIR
ncbi:MAG: T9SS type A sorting domain-containing protein [Chitinophagaceae bacterium]|nr:T9SS type A sorting domain-containing protein [Chitinophagaceae bacterium]